MGETTDQAKQYSSMFELQGQDHIEALRDIIAVADIQHLRELSAALDDLSETAEDALLALAGECGDY